MRVTVNPETLKTALASVDLKVKSPIPILDCVHLSANGQGIYLLTTDLNMTRRQRIPATVARGKKVALLPNLAHLLRATRMLPKADVEIVARNGAPVLIYGKGKEIALDGFDTQEFPEQEAVFNQKKIKPFCELPKDELLLLLEKVGVSASTDPTRPQLQGVKIHLVKQGKKKFLRAVATDGHRLHYQQMPTTLRADAANQAGVFLGNGMVKALCTHLKKELADRVKLGIYRKDPKDQVVSVVASCGDFEASFRWDTGFMFPDYNRVLPTSPSTKLTFDKKDLSEAMKRIKKAYSGENANKALAAIDATGKGKVTVKTGGRSDFSISEEVKGKGGAQQPYGVNSTYLLDTLAQVDGDTVTMAFEDNVSISKITDPANKGFVSVIMPVKL